MMQTRLRMFPGTPVCQQPLEPITVGATPPPTTGRGPRIVALEPLSDEAARGVPPEQVLVIRDESGAIIEADVVVLQLMSISPEIAPSTFYEANGLVGNSREIWHVSFQHHDG